MGEDPVVNERFMTPYGRCTPCYFGIHVHRTKSEGEKDNINLAVALENRRPLDVNLDKSVGGRDENAYTHVELLLLLPAAFRLVD